MRWPGLDGVTLLALDIFATAIYLVRGDTGLGPPLLVVLGLTAVWLAATRLTRRPDAGEPPQTLRPLVVIPTKDNPGTLAEVVMACLAHHPDVLVVDDGSTTPVQTDAHLVRHPRNLGKGAALNTALAWASEHGFSHIIAIDADGQHFADDLPRFLAAIRDRPDAIHAGLRDMSEAPVGAGRARANSNLWLWVETGQWIGDTQCGYRAYPVHPVRSLGVPSSRYQWEVEVLARAVWYGVPVLDLPCRVFYPPKEERVSSYRKVIDTALVTWMNAILVTERIVWPPRWIRPAPRADWRGRHLGTVRGWKLLLGVLKLTGRRATMAFVTPLAAFYWAVGSSSRAGLEAYLRRRFPDASPLARAWMALKITVFFGWSIVDRFTLLVGGALPLDRTDVDELRDALYAERQGIVLLSAHLGNPDLASTMLRGKASRSVNIVMHVAAGDPYLALVRESFGDAAPNIIPLERDGEPASIDILRALRRNEVVAMKMDRVVNARTVAVPFLGDPIHLPTGPLLMAALSGAAVVLVSCFREPGGRYRLVSTEPRTLAFGHRDDRDADLARWAGELAATLEDWTERYPLQWYNFHDPWSGLETT